jgi:hypothetical protein
MFAYGNPDHVPIHGRPQPVTIIVSVLLVTKHRRSDVNHVVVLFLLENFVPCIRSSVVRDLDEVELAVPLRVLSKYILTGRSSPHAASYCVASVDESLDDVDANKRVSASDQCVRHDVGGWK